MMVVTMMTILPDKLRQPNHEHEQNRNKEADNEVSIHNCHIFSPGVG
jgi:hypothetical protein